MCVGQVGILFDFFFFFLQDRVKTILISTNIAESIIVKTRTWPMNVSTFCFQASDTSKHSNCYYKYSNSVHNFYICWISTNDTPVDGLQ